MLVNCGYCDEIVSSLEFHDCEEAANFEQDLDYYRSMSNKRNVPPSVIAEAEAFLKTHPEFVERSAQSDVKSYQRVAVGLTYEQTDWLTPVAYESVTGLPIEKTLDEELSEREEEWQGIYELREYDSVLQGTAPWRDVEPTRCTTAFHYWKTDRRVGLMPEGYMPRGFSTNETYVQHYEALDFERPELMRLEFNELRGFASELLIDADITEKFQFTVFNAYVGRDQKFHIGLLTFNRTEDNRISVTCGHGSCHYRKVPFFSPANPTRVQMEDFVTACIKHGNNHGPDWITQRKDFTFIHAQNCDTLHERSQPCNANWPRLDVNRLDATDREAVYNFLIHHRKFCRTTECRCTHYYHMLSELITDNYANVA